MMKDRYRVLRKLMDSSLSNADKYTHNGSTWLIFTDTKKWAIELTEDRVLWYNYTFFRSLFSIATDDITIFSKYITEWVEDNLINIDRVNPGGHVDYDEINKVIDDGVKESNHVDVMNFFNNKMEDTLQNGIKETKIDEFNVSQYLCERAIDDGVKETIYWNESLKGNLEDFGSISNVIENGVKKTMNHNCESNNLMAELIIKEGVKEIKTPGKDGDITGHLNWLLSNGRDIFTSNIPQMIDDVVEKGVKETKVCNYTDPKTGLIWIKWGNDIDEVIKEGVQETKVSDYNGDGYQYIITDQYIIDRVIDKGEVVSGTFVGGKRQKENVDSVIDYGVKDTKSDSSQNPMGKVTKVIENGIKETKYANKYESIGPVVKQHKIDTIIKYGVLKTEPANYEGKLVVKDRYIQKIIVNGIKNPTD